MAMILEREFANVTFAARSSQTRSDLLEKSEAGRQSLKARGLSNKKKQNLGVSKMGGLYRPLGTGSAT